MYVEYMFLPPVCQGVGGVGATLQDINLFFKGKMEMDKVGGVTKSSGQACALTLKHVLTHVLLAKKHTRLFLVRSYFLLLSLPLLCNLCAA